MERPDHPEHDGQRRARVQPAPGGRAGPGDGHARALIHHELGQADGRVRIPRRERVHVADLGLCVAGRCCEEFVDGRSRGRRRDRDNAPGAPRDGFFSDSRAGSQAGWRSRELGSPVRSRERARVPGSGPAQCLGRGAQGPGSARRRGRRVLCRRFDVGASGRAEPVRARVPARDRDRARHLCSPARGRQGGRDRAGER